MHLSLSASLLLALSATTATVSALNIVTVPIKSLRNPANLNAESLTRRYLQKRAGASSTSQLTSVENDVVYTIPLQLGTPPQTFNVAIDTGSPITWVSSNSCTGAGCDNSTTFNCAASSSCQQQSETFNASYVSGQGVAGNYVSEKFALGSLQFQGTAGVVTSNAAVLPAAVDGLMGLWFYPTPTAIPILNVLKNTTSLAQNLIGIWLEPSLATNETAPGGEITFGGVDTTRFSGNISFTNCVTDRPWTLPIGGMTVGGTVIDVGGANAAIDTGTTAMLMPETVADDINGAIPNALKVTEQGGLWFLPCSGNTVITLTFGSYKATIPYTNLAMQSTAQKTSQGDYCLSAAMFPTGSTSTISEWLIGDAFLKSVYSVFDFSTSTTRIGFAQLGSGGNATTMSTSSQSGNNANAATWTKSPQGLTLILQAVSVAIVSVLLAFF